ncbi:MAG: hypothetical protein IPH80_21960 [Myxococcales bacterium]|nr:hypothetical protein [Myxococcales bacterium]
MTMRRLPTLALLAAACSEPPPSRSAPFPSGPTERLTFPAAPRRELDLLFVIDNSGSTVEWQMALTAAFPVFLAGLRDDAGALPDLHVGVVTTNLGSGGVPIGGCSTAARPDGDDGRLTNNGCAGIDGSFLRDGARADGTRDVNYTGLLPDRFRCMAQRGSSGCGFEASLGAMRRALEPGHNPGFLRGDAALGIVIQTDEDDCSVADPTFFGDPNATVASPLGPRTSFRCHEFGVQCDDDPEPRAFGVRTGCRSREDSPFMPSVASYVRFLVALKPAPGQVAVTAMFGEVDAARTVEIGPDPNDTSRPWVASYCASSNGVANPGFRLAHFIDAVGGTSRTICRDGFDETMAAFAARIHVTLGVPCFAGAVHDADPAAPGVQAQCTVGETTVATGDFHLLPACADGLGGACWRVVEDAARCPLGAHHYLAIERPAAAPTGATLTATCTVD